MKIVGKFWWGALGVVVIQPEVGERKAYIGHGFGVSEPDDANSIARTGMPVYKEQLEQILKTMKK